MISILCGAIDRSIFCCEAWLTPEGHVGWCESLYRRDFLFPETPLQDSVYLYDHAFFNQRVRQSETDYEDRPGDSRPTSPIRHRMGRPRTYGARKKHASAAASAIFGRNPRKSLSKVPTSPERSALADITAAVSNLNLVGDNENEENRTGHKREECGNDESKPKLPEFPVVS